MLVALVTNIRYVHVWVYPKLGVTRYQMIFNSEPGWESKICLVAVCGCRPVRSRRGNNESDRVQEGVTGWARVSHSMWGGATRKVLEFVIWWQ